MVLIGASTIHVQSHVLVVLVCVALCCAETVEVLAPLMQFCASAPASAACVLTVRYYVVWSLGLLQLLQGQGMSAFAGKRLLPAQL